MTTWEQEIEQDLQALGYRWARALLVTEFTRAEINKLCEEAVAQRRL